MRLAARRDRTTFLLSLILFPHGIAGSELEPQGKHNLALQCGTGKSCVEDRSAILAIHASLRIIQIDVVEEVEDVSSKLKGYTFVEQELLCDRKIGLEEAWPTQRISRGVSERAGSRPLPRPDSVPGCAIWLEWHTARGRKIAVSTSCDVYGSDDVGSTGTAVPVGETT